MRIALVALGPRLPLDAITQYVERITAQGGTVDLVSWPIPVDELRPLFERIVVLCRPAGAPIPPLPAKKAEAALAAAGDSAPAPSDAASLDAAGAGALVTPADASLDSTAAVESAALAGADEAVADEAVADEAVAGTAQEAVTTAAAPPPVAAGSPGPRPTGLARVRPAVAWRVRRVRRRVRNVKRTVKRRVGPAVRWRVRRVRQFGRRKYAVVTTKVLTPGVNKWRLIRGRRDAMAVIADADLIVAYDAASLLAVWHLARKHEKADAVNGLPAAVTWVSSRTAGPQ